MNQEDSVKPKRALLKFNLLLHTLQIQCSVYLIIKTTISMNHHHMVVPWSSLLSSCLCLHLLPSAFCWSLPIHGSLANPGTMLFIIPTGFGGALALLSTSSITITCFGSLSLAELQRTIWSPWVALMPLSTSSSSALVSDIVLWCREFVLITIKQCF